MTVASGSTEKPGRTAKSNDLPITLLMSVLEKLDDLKARVVRIEADTWHEDAKAIRSAITALEIKVTNLEQAQAQRAGAAMALNALRIWLPTTAALIAFVVLFSDKFPLK